jgi:hypothetical protein
MHALTKKLNSLIERLASSRLFQSDMVDITR